MMATLYRPTIVEYRLPDGSYRTPDGKRVTKDTPGAIKSSRKSKKWYGRYTDGSGRPMRVPLSESKETSRRMLAKIAGDAQLAGVGIVDPFAEHRSRPLPEHLEDFRRYLAAKGNTGEYCQKIASRARVVLDGCRFRKIEDLQPSAVLEFLADLRFSAARPTLHPEQEWYTVDEVAALLAIQPKSVRRIVFIGLLPGPQVDRQADRPQRLHRDSVAALIDRRCQGLSIGTSNGYLAAIKRFSKWLWKDRRAPLDALAHLSRMNAEVDQRHPRRALRAEQFDRFVDATAAGKAYRGLSGSDRLVLHTLAANTGLRAKELANLEPASFDLASDPPTVRVEAAYSKHRRQDIQQLRPDVAEMMRQYLAGKPARAKIWPGSWQRAAAEMLRIDLAAAGICYQDDSGRYFDFHAMRGQFISLLAANGVHPKVAQTLARHSTITLTMDYYTHLDVLDVTGALEKLPLLGGKKGPGEARRKRSGEA
jgi:integrase